MHFISLRLTVWDNVAAPVIKPQIPVKDFVGGEGDFLF